MRDTIKHQMSEADSIMALDLPPADYEVTIELPDGTEEIRNATVTSGEMTELGPAACLPPPGVIPPEDDPGTE